MWWKVFCRKEGERVGREKERREKKRCSVSTITSNNSNLDTEIFTTSNNSTQNMQTGRL